MTTSIKKKVFWNSFSNQQKSAIPHLRMSNLTQIQQNYVLEVVETTEKLFGTGAIKSVILFGSTSHDIASNVSDIDLLVITKDHISTKDIKKARRFLDTIEIKHNLAYERNNLIEKIVDIVNKNTGMFCSYFLCRENDWNNNDFTQIFSTSRILTYILAPDKIVLNSMRAGSKCIYGNVSLEFQKERLTSFQLIKSLLMNLLIWLGALLIIPFKQKNMLYFLESFKWSLRSCSFILHNDIRPLKKIIENYSRIAETNEYLTKFSSLRENLKLDLPFALQTPFHIIKMHGLALRYLNQKLKKE